MENGTGGLENGPQALSPSELEQNPEKPKTLGYDDLIAYGRFVPTEMGTAVIFAMAHIELAKVAPPFTYSKGRGKGKANFAHHLILHGNKPLTISCNTWMLLTALQGAFSISKALGVPEPKNLYLKLTHTSEDKYIIDLLGVTDKQGVLVKEVKFDGIRYSLADLPSEKQRNVGEVKIKTIEPCPL